MPIPNSGDPWLIQMLRSYGKRLTNLEQSFTGIKDAAGRIRVKWGLLANGDYGIAITDIDGNTQELLPAVAGFTPGVITATSATPGPPATGTSPSVTFVVGASGDFEVTATSFVGVPANSSASIWVQLDGGAPSNFCGVSNSNVQGVASSCCTIQRWSDISGSTTTPGSHTVTLLYSSSSGTCNFSGGNYLKIQPV